MRLTPNSWGSPLREADAKAHTGILVALWLKPKPAKQLAKLGTEMPRDMHITLAYCKTGTYDRAAQALEDVAKRTGSRLYGHTIGAGRFPPSESSDHKTVVWAKPYVPNMAHLRSRVVKALAKVGVRTSRDFNTWTPHITLAYVDRTAALPEVPKIPLEFDRITLVQGDRRQEFPIGGARS